jgi:hypothetical protein
VTVYSSVFLTHPTIRHNRDPRPLIPDPHLWLYWTSGIYPGGEAALQYPHVGITGTNQSLRRTGAFFIGWSLAVEDHVPSPGELTDPLLSFSLWDAYRALYVLHVKQVLATHVYELGVVGLM